MPQMSPLMWFYLFLYFLFTYYIVMSEIYFFNIFVKLKYFKMKKLFKQYFKWLR